jgi:hypothetical protein
VNIDLSVAEQHICQTALRAWHGHIRRQANRYARDGEVDRYKRSVTKLEEIEDLYGRFGGDVDALLEEEKPVTSGMR